MKTSQKTAFLINLKPIPDKPCSASDIFPLAIPVEQVLMAASANENMARLSTCFYYQPGVIAPCREMIGRVSVVGRSY